MNHTGNNVYVRVQARPCVCRGMHGTNIETEMCELGQMHDMLQEEDENA